MLQALNGGNVEQTDKLRHLGPTLPRGSERHTDCNTQQQILWWCLSQATLTVIPPRIKAPSQFGFFQTAASHTLLFFDRNVSFTPSLLRVLLRLGKILTEPVHFM